jgi:drug/metabolite transporter (DMT)-like permease
VTVAPASDVTRRPGLGLLAATAAVVVWGASSVAIKQVDDLNGLGLACYRIWLGALLVTVAFLATGGRVTRRLLRLSFWGGITFTADLVLFFCAVQETSIANATVIGALQPLLVLAVASRLFGERARMTEVAWGGVAVAGTALVILGGDGGGANSTWGNVLAVGALISWTAYFVFTKTARQELTSFEYLTGMAIVSAVAVIPLPLIFDGTLGSTDLDGWLVILYLTVVNGLLGHFLMAFAHGHVTLLTVSLLTLAIPVFAAAGAALWIDEPLTWVQVGGMVVVLVALGLVSLSTARRSPDLLEADVEALEALPTP